MWHKRMALFLTSKIYKNRNFLFPISKHRNMLDLLCCLASTWLLKWYASIAVYYLGVLWILPWSILLHEQAFISWLNVISALCDIVAFIWNVHPWWRMGTSSTECYNFTQDALACSMFTFVHTLLPSDMINNN